MGCQQVLGIPRVHRTYTHDEKPWSLTSPIVDMDFPGFARAKLLNLPIVLGRATCTGDMYIITGSNIDGVYPGILM
ncbi:hypothetical protein LY76DRAFT_662850 [Colletotrichum caudatum]|nr:hypothetical protein LY76DRAFT_662850 [Colletotrichum caudatum]